MNIAKSETHRTLEEEKLRAQEKIAEKKRKKEEEKKRLIEEKEAQLERSRRAV